MEKFQQAETEEAQRQILERFAQGLPVTNRTIKGGINIVSYYLWSEKYMYIIYYIVYIFSSNSFLWEMSIN